MLEYIRILGLYKKQFLICAIGLFVLSACVASIEQTKPLPVVPKSRNVSTFRLSFSQVACPRYFCENYRLDIQGNEVQRVALHSKNKSINKRRLSQNNVERLINLTNQLTMGSTSTQVVPGEVSCKIYKTDMQNYRIQLVNLNGDPKHIKKIEIYAGCESIDPQLIDLVSEFKAINRSILQPKF